MDRDMDFELKLPRNLTRLIRTAAEEYRCSMEETCIEIFRQYFESLAAKTLGNEVTGGLNLKIPADLYQTLTARSEEMGKSIDVVCTEIIKWFFLTA